MRVRYVINNIYIQHIAQIDLLVLMHACMHACQASLDPPNSNLLIDLSYLEREPFHVVAASL